MKNKTSYIEYIQIFVYHELIIQGKSIVDIEDYIRFELTDNIISSFNIWIVDSNHKNSVVMSWFDANADAIEFFSQNFPTKFKPKVSIWSDRIKSNYYKEKLQDSFIFENYIAEEISEKYGLDLGQYLTPEGQYELGENALGIEIKNDTLISKYGNVYIEYQEKSSASNYNYVNSGILKIDNCVYLLIGTVEKYYIFKKDKLIEILNEEIENITKGIMSSRDIVFKQIATSKGYVYPVKNAISDTISMDTMINEIKAKLNL